MACLTSLDTTRAILRVLESMTFSAHSMKEITQTKRHEVSTCMMQKQNMIVVNQEIAKNIYELVLQGTLVQQMNEPGQFVH